MGKLSRYFAISFLILVAIGCGAQQKKTSPFDMGRLGRLNEVNKHKVASDENKAIEKVIASAKKEVKKTHRLSFPMPKPLNEETLYSQVLASFKGRDLNGLEFYANEFAALFKNSVFADNAIYLDGNLKLLMGLPSEALRSFERVLKEYPTGNKRASALFGKGVAYRKLNLNQYALNVYEQLKREFPGSPEFYKVELEIKLISLNK